MVSVFTWPHFGQVRVDWGIKPGVSFMGAIVGRSSGVFKRAKTRHSGIMTGTNGGDGGTMPQGGFEAQLELLAFVNRAFAEALDINDTLKKTLEHITHHLDAEGGALFLLDEDGQALRCEACVGPTDITGLTIKSDEGIVGRSVQSNTGEIIRDTSKDPQFLKSVDDETGFYTRSILCAPMTVQDEKIGAIEMVNRRGGDGLFSVSDLHTLQALSTSAGFAIMNARQSEALVEQERINRELELAAEIQRSLLPGKGDIGYPVAGVNHPARVVSGDFYDFFSLDDGRICFNLGDVSGKGMNAALLMAKTASLFRCLGKEIHDPGRLLSRVNDEICETITRGMFVTMVGGIYNPRSGVVRIANAGHEPVLVHHPDGSFVEVSADAPPLGIVPGLDGIKEVEIELGNGALYIFTDGVTEGYLADGSELGQDGVRHLISDNMGKSPQERLAAVMAPVGSLGGKLRDDLTMLVVDGHEGAAHALTLGSSYNMISSFMDEGGIWDDVTGDESGLLGRLRVSARPDRLKMIRSLVTEAVRQCGSETNMQDVVLAVDEACQNVIRHAYGETGEGDIEIMIRHRDGILIVDILDFADPIDPSAVKPRDLDDVRPGGLGTHFIMELMDEVRFLPVPEGGGNLLRMVKKVSKKDL